MSGRIVVGVDGSVASVKAVRWACAEARRRDDTVEVVRAWDLPAVEQRAADELAEVVRANRAGGAMVPVTSKLARGDAAHVLVELARGADLLVVGSSGMSGMVGRALGSVSSYVVHHAPCPVVIVRPDAA